MNCKHCSNPFKNEDTFCYHCGNTLEHEPTAPLSTDTHDTSNFEYTEPPEVSTTQSTYTDTSSFNYGDNFNNQESTVKKPNSHRKLLIIASAVALFVLIVILIISNNPLSNFKNSIDNSDYPTAYKIFIEMNSNEQDNAIEYIYENSERIVNEFNSETLTYDDAHATLMHYEALIGKYINTNEELYKDLKLLGDLAYSRESYNYAQSAESSNDLNSAIHYYSLVIPTDKNYSSAQNKIDTLNEAYQKEMSEANNEMILNKINEAEEYANEGNYLDAIRQLSSISEPTSAVQEKYTQYAHAHKEQIFKTVDTALKEKRFSDAISALKDMEDDLAKHFEIVEVDTNSKLDECKGAYISDTQTSVDTLISQNKYSEAISTIRTLQADLSDDTLLENLVAEYTDKLPVKLSSLEAMDREFKIKTVDDIYGNIYTDAFVQTVRFTYGGYGPYDAEYLANSKYQYISGTIAAHDDSTSNSSECIFKVEIYADNSLVYTSPNMNKKSEPVNFNVSINKAKFVKIVVVRVINESDIMAVLSDFSFHNNTV